MRQYSCKKFKKRRKKKNSAGVSNIVQLLSALELSGSMILVELLISIFCREEGQHVHEDAIQDALAAFTKR